MATEPGLTEYVTSTLRARSKIVKDNVTNNNAAFAKGKETGMFESYDGGRDIVEEFSFDDNGSFQWFEGNEVVNTSYNPTLTSAVFSHKQASIACFISDYEKLINSGSASVIKLVAQRMQVAEDTMLNKVNASFLSDGTASGGKEMAGLGHLVPTNSATGTVGGIDRSGAAATFYRSQALAVTATFGAAKSAANIKQAFLRQKLLSTRGKDSPNIALSGNTDYESIMMAAMAIQHLTDPKLAKLGFENVIFQGIPVAHAGGIIFGGETLIGDTVTFLLQTKYLKLRHHKDCWMDVMEERQSINQHSQIKFMALMGNFTLSIAKTQSKIYDA